MYDFNKNPPSNSDRIFDAEERPAARDTQLNDYCLW